MAMMMVVLRTGALGFCADCPRDGSRRLLCSSPISAKPFRGRSSDSLQEGSIRAVFEGKASGSPDTPCTIRLQKHADCR